MHVLAQANEIARRKWGRTGRWGKAFIITGATLAGLIGLALLVMLGAFKFLKSLSVGATHNSYLYIPHPPRRRR